MICSASRSIRLFPSVIMIPRLKIMRSLSPPTMCSSSSSRASSLLFWTRTAMSSSSISNSDSCSISSSSSSRAMSISSSTATNNNRFRVRVGRGDGRSSSLLFSNTTTSCSNHSFILRASAAAAAPKASSSSLSMFSTRAASSSSSSSSSIESLAPVTTTTSASSTTSSSSTISTISSKNDRPPTYTRPQVLHTPDGREIAIFRPAPVGNRKLKPHIVKRRLQAMKTYIGQEKNIRHSPWRLNLLCQFVSGLPLQLALLQLQFNKKVKSKLVHDVLKRTANLADIRDGIQISSLEVAECFVTRGTPLKRINIMGRGRSGKLEHRHCHMRVVLREIDFPLRIYQAHTMNQKRIWFQRQQQAERDGIRARTEREQVQRLERQAAEKKVTTTTTAQKK